MEEDIANKSKSPISALVEARLEEAIDTAQKKIMYKSAHDPELLEAIQVVEAFLRKRKRVCYGGTAMNMLLPPSKRFYDTSYEIPDYDFFSPNPDADTEELVKMLEEAGLHEVYHKVGIHKGTKKVLVNFVPIADITHISPGEYSVFLKRSIVREGIHYTDADMLRMMMYLELSRPAGQVDRWMKVYERLELLNTEFPVKVGVLRCKTRKRGASAGKHVSAKVRQILYNFLIEYQRILVNGPLTEVYERGILQGNSELKQAGSGGCVVFLSPTPHRDAKAIRDILQPHSGQSFKVLEHPAVGENAPERLELQIHGIPICLILQDTACHSYSPVSYEGGQTIFVGSLELLITLYSALGFFTKQSQRYFDGVSPLCHLKKLIHLSRLNVRTKSSQFPPFAVLCKGHQTGYASLLRQKVERIKAEKKGQSTRTRKASKKKHTG